MEGYSIPASSTILEAACIAGLMAPSSISKAINNEISSLSVTLTPCFCCPLSSSDCSPLYFSHNDTCEYTGPIWMIRPKMEVSHLKVLGWINSAKSLLLIHRLQSLEHDPPWGHPSSNHKNTTHSLPLIYFSWFPHHQNKREKTLFSQDLSDSKECSIKSNHGRWLAVWTVANMLDWRRKMSNALRQA